MPADSTIRRRALAPLAVVSLITVSFACTSSSAPPGSESTSTTTRVVPAATPGGTARKVDGAFFGFNGASIVQTINVDLLLDPRLQQELADFPTRLIRVPTGTAAQWIDWRTGRFIEDPTSPFASIPADRRPVTMQDWATLIESSGATPVWDLNVLNATLDDQIAMLEEARRLGLPVEYIELGNELWDARSIYPEVFPTGADYAKTMNTWIPELRDRFGDVQIAVSGADPSDEFFVAVFGERYRDWNAQLLATIHDADAIAIHPYWTLPERAEPGSDVAATLTAGLDAWDAVVTETLEAIPEEMDVWLTEWNQAAWASDSGTQIWAQALSVVAVALRQLNDPQITMSLVHDIVDGVANPHDAGISTTFPVFTNGAGDSAPLDRTALGHALPLLYGAVEPDDTVTALDIPAASGTGPVPGIHAVMIEGTHPGALFVNLTAARVQVRLGDELAGTWVRTAVSASPDAQPGWDPADRVETVESTATGTVDVPGYSVVRLARS